MGIQDLDWEGCCHTSRHIDQVFAAGFCSLLQLTLSHKAQIHRGTPVHFSTLQQHRDSSNLPSFRSVGWKYLVNINYYIPRLEKYSIAQNAVSLSGLWRQGTILSCTYLLRLEKQTQLIQSTGWLSQSNLDSPKTEIFLSWILEDFIQDAIVCLTS